MLFLTVYGPELESIFYYIHKFNSSNDGISREQLYSAYFPHLSSSSKGQTKNLEDAVNYLKAAGLIIVDVDRISISKISEVDMDLPFSALLLRRFRSLESSPSDVPLIDRLYITLLERLYILPNRMWINDVHAAANQLDLAHQIGGISQEKINAWKRVMEFLGLGYRMGSGFYCLYQPEFVLSLIRKWTHTESTLQEFFENYLQFWLPCLSARGEVALPVAHALDQLALDGHINLYPKQDSPSKPYFSARRLRGIKIL
jgi:hypothetical protein